MAKHQDTFDILREALSTALVLEYQNFSRKFFSGDRCFFKWSRCHPISTSQGGEYLCNNICKPLPTPPRKIYGNYSSAKLELLLLNGAIMQKIWDYLLGLWFQVYRDNNPLTYVQDSKLGASQIQWLSEPLHYSILLSGTDKDIPTGPKMH